MLKKLFTCLFVAFSLTGCANFQDYTAEPRRFEEPRFTDQTPIRLKVNKIEVISEFTPSFRRPNVEHLFPVSIEKTARIWAKDRLEAVDFSSNKVARFIIKDASVTEKQEKSSELFSPDRIVYRARLAVTLKISDFRTESNAETTIEAWRELTIPADTDIDEKERYWNSMVQKLFSEFNQSMEANINQYLNMYVVSNDYIQEFN